MGRRRSGKMTVDYAWYVEGYGQAGASAGTLSDPFHCTRLGGESVLIGFVGEDIWDPYV